MDFGSLLGGIGSFLGGLFGGNQKKQQQQNQPQQGRPVSVQHNVVPITGPAQPQNTVRVPQPFAPPAPVAPVLGGVNHSVPVEAHQSQASSIQLPDWLKPITDFTAQSNDQSYGAATRGIANVVNSFATGFNPDETAKRTNDFLRTIGQNNNASGQSLLAHNPIKNSPFSSDTDKNSTAGQLGQAVGQVGRGVAETVPLIAVPGAAAATLPGRIAVGAGTGGGAGFLQGASQGANLKTDLQSAGIGGIIGGGIPIVGGVLRPLSASAASDAGGIVRDPASPITTTPTTGKAPAITSPNRPVTPAPIAPRPQPATPSNFAPDDGLPSFMRRNTPTLAPAPISTSVDPIDTPAFVHKNAMQQVISDGNNAIEQFVAAHPDATPAQIQQAHDTITGQVKAQLSKMQDARAAAYGSEKPAEAPVAQVPKPVEPIPAPNQAPVPPVEEPKIPFGEDSTAAKVDNTQEVAPNPDAVARVNAAKRAVYSKTNVIRATHTNSGNELANGMENAEDRHLDLTGNWMSQLKTTFKLNKSDFEKAWRVQEGQLDRGTVSPKVARAADELKAVMPQIKEAAQKADVINGDLGDTYLPHVYAKKGATVRMPGDSTANARQYGNLEKERTGGGDNYQRTPEVLQSYIDRAAQRIGQAEQFGSKNEVAKQLISKIGAEGGDQAIADKAFSQYYNSPTSDSTLAKGFKGVRAVQSALQLPLAAVSHAAQTSNVAADTGILNTLKATAKTVFQPKKSGALAKRAGVTTPQALGHYQKEYTSFGSKLANKVTAPLLKPVMKFNRTVAANAYDQAAAKMAAKGDGEGLAKLGVKGDTSSGKLTNDQKLQAVRGGTKRTMFVNSAADTPVNAETPIGKTIWQYRGAYARPQTGFIANQVLKPLAHGNVAPLARYAVAGGAGAVGTTMAKNAIAGRPNDPASVAGSVIPTMAGLPGEIANSVLKYGARNPVGTAVGIIAPIAGEGVKALTAAGQSAKDKSIVPLERYALGKVPIYGSKLAATMTPTASQKSAALNPSQPTAGAPSTGNPITDFANGVGNFVNGITHPTPPDAATTELQRLTNDNGVKFTTAESNALKSKDINPLANNLVNDPLYQAADDQSKLSMMKNVLHGTATKGINSSLGKDDKQALIDYKIQTAPDKKAWLDDNANASKYYTALYNNAVANKSLNPQLDNDLSNKHSLKYQMVAAEVDEKYNADPELKADYAATTQAKFIQLLNPKSATYDADAAQTLYNYDQARVAAGLPPRYNMDVVNKSLAKAAATGNGTAKSFSFPSLPSSLVGTSAGTGSASKYANPSSLYQPIASLKTPATATIPKGRAISVSKIQTL